VRGERDELDGKGAGVGTEDEAAFVEVDEAEQESGSAADGVEGGLVGTVGSEGVVVAVEDGDGSGGDDGVHGGGLLGVGADGEETLPVSMGAGGSGAVVVEAGGGDLDGFDDGGGGDASLVHSGGGGDDGNDLGGVAGGDGRDGGEVEGEDLLNGKVLRGEDAVEAFKREGAFAVEEIRDMGLLETCLLGETAAGESATVDAPKEFKSKEFMKVLKGHRFFSRRVSYLFIRRRLGENVTYCNIFLMLTTPNRGYTRNSFLRKTFD